MKLLAFTSAARREFRTLPPEVQGTVRSKLLQYAGSGEGDVRKLAGEPGVRLRVGDYRVIFVETADQIEIRAVRHRREAYR